MDATPDFAHPDSVQMFVLEYILVQQYNIGCSLQVTFWIHT